MLILGLEFSSPRRTVALVEHSVGQGKVLGMVSDHGNRSVKPLTLIEALLKDVGVSRSSVGCLAVGRGPGSYTGIRSAISLAQGWRLAREIKLAGVSSVECLSLQASENGWHGHVQIVIDAQRNELYLADYAIGPSGRELIKPLRLVKVDDLRGQTADGKSAVIGPEATKWFEGALDVFPEAQALARLAAAQVDVGSGGGLEPIYLRQTTFVKASPPRTFPS